MKTLASVRQFLSLLLATLLLLTPAIAQQKKPTTTPTPSSSESAVSAPQAVTKEAEITFDTLLAARSYKIYGEVRMIGQLARSNAVTELIEPARLLGAPPKELTRALEFLSANADALATSRLMFAATPARAGLPQNFVAVELASPEDAIKLEPKFRSFFTSLKTETPVPAQSVANKTETKKPVPTSKPQAVIAPPIVKPVHIQRAGSLILMSDAPFTLKNLRPDGSLPLSSDQNLQRARSRFASESLFLYYDVDLSPHVTTAARLVASPPSPRSEPQFKVKKSPGQTEITARPDEPPPPVVAPTPSVAPETSAPDMTVEEELATTPEIVGVPAELKTGTGAQESKRSSDQLAMAVPLFGALVGGEPNLPEAVGVAVALEGDDVIVRAMLLNAPGTPNNVIPFIPALISGPEITPKAAALSPAETGLFVSASLDWPRIYDAMLKGMKGSRRPVEEGSQETDGSSAFELRIAMLEQALGFKIKEDLLGSLGNEVAVNVPANVFKFGPNNGIQIAGEASTTTTSSQTGVAVFISLSDQERVKEMLPRVLEVIGLKAPGAAAPTEKRADFEITNYGAVSITFIDDFLVISPEVAALRSVIDAHENSRTLAGNVDFKNSMNWQSSRVLGQVYLSPELTSGEQSYVQLDDKLQELISRLNQKPAPITHAVVNDNAGLFHELHLPRGWVALMLAGLTADRTTTPIMDNEMRTIGALMSIRAAEVSYKSGKGKGSFATHDQLVSENLVPKLLLEREGYRIEMTVTGDKFEVTATPTEYGKTGRQSFYLDESGIIRGADHGGQPATVADKPL